MKSLIMGHKPTISRKGISMNPVKYPHKTQFEHWKLIASHIPCTANQSVKWLTCKWHFHHGIKRNITWKIVIFSDHGNIFPMVIPCKAVDNKGLGIN